MKLNNKFAQRLVLCAAPLVTGSVLVALPGLAATLATSTGGVGFNNFSHNPQDTQTGAFTDTLAIANGSQVTADAGADAAFIVDNTNPARTEAFHAGGTIVQGSGKDYTGRADSNARLAGYNFNVGSGETLSFDFSGFLGLNTSYDYEEEATNAFGTVAFQLFDVTNANTAPVFLDYFTIFGEVNSENNFDFLNTDKSANVALNSTEMTSFGGDQEVAQSSFLGKFSRLFERAASVVLVAFNTNSSGASCSIR
ncbi:MAG: hypothetical protein AB1589_18720 [Cyanobacteriota bacterium]